MATKGPNPNLLEGKLSFHPLTPDRWDDLETLFGARGACAGCWCMWWRLSRGDWIKGKGEANRRAFKKLVATGPPPGILAYCGRNPVGWCALAPREEYSGLARARSLKPVDNQPVWSITCFFISKDHRRKGLSVALLNGAAVHAKKNRARLLEGYPSVLKTPDAPAAFIWTGTERAFMRAGFKVVARPSASRAIMRRELK